MARFVILASAIRTFLPIGLIIFITLSTMPVDANVIGDDDRESFNTANERRHPFRSVGRLETSDRYCTATRRADNDIR